MPDTIKLLNISWTDFKTSKTRDSFDIYYVDGTSSVEVIGVTPSWTYYVKLFGADLTDFNTNFESAATEVPSIDDAIATANPDRLIDVNVSSTEPGGGPYANIPWLASGMVYKNANYQTTSANEETLLSHTVATGKTFYLLFYAISLGQTGGVTAYTGEARVRVDGTIRDASHFSTILDGGGSVGGIEYNRFLYCQARLPFPFADSGEIITLTIDEDGSSGHSFDATLYGFEATPA